MSTIDELKTERDQLREALAFMLNIFDTPIARRRIDSEYADEARVMAREALK